VARRDSVAVEQLFGPSAVGYFAHRQRANDRALVLQRLADGVAKPSMRVVVFHRDDAAARRAAAVDERIFVDRLHAEHVHHTYVDVLVEQILVCDEGLVQRHSGGHHQRAVFVAAPDDFRFADLESLARIVDHGRLRTARADIHRTAVSSGQLDRTPCADRIRRVQHDVVGLGAHHRQVFESHL
jgi:hypothetical protein